VKPGMAALPLCVGVGACVHDERPATERGAASVFENTQTINAPALDRCEQHKRSSLRQPCEDAKYLAQKYARAMSVGDQVCLEGGFGDAPAAACLARASVADATSTKILFHLADTQPSSRWYKYVGTEVWFQEGALVDLYLAERGY
jgi:hypothetical protein